MSELVYFWLLLKASLLSTSGMGNLPILHQDLAARGMAVDQQFAEALAIGQVSPGPNGLWVISLAYLMRGGIGALLSVVAITLPPLLVLAVDRLYRRVSDHPAVEGFVQGLSLAVVGIFVVVLAGVLGSAGYNLRTAAILTASLALGLTRRVPVVVVIALAAIAGVVFP